MILMYMYIQKLSEINLPCKIFTGVKSVTSLSLPKRDERVIYGERNELSVFDTQHNFHGKCIMNGGDISRH